jgi:hypothetical protein
MGIPSYPSLFYILATIIHSLTRIGLIPAPPSEANFRKLLFGALRVPDVAHGLLVCPSLLPRLAQAARGRFTRLDSPLRELRFHGFTFNFSAAASLR